MQHAKEIPRHGKNTDPPSGSTQKQSLPSGQALPFYILHPPLEYARGMVARLARNSKALRLPGAPGRDVVPDQPGAARVMPIERLGHVHAVADAIEPSLVRIFDLQAPAAFNEAADAENPEGFHGLEGGAQVMGGVGVDGRLLVVDQDDDAFDHVPRRGIEGV